MSLLWNLEWNTQNEARAYPFAADASRTDISGAFKIPDDFIVGLYLPIHAGLDVEPGNFFVSSIGVFGAGFRVVVSYYTGTGDPITVATAIIPRATHTEFNVYQMPGQGDFADTGGLIVIGKLDTLDTLPAGQYNFDFGSAQLEVDAIHPMIQYVSSLVVINGSDRSPRLYGDIEIEAGTNFRITVTNADTARPRLRFDAIQGEGLNESCVCDETQAPPIRTINGIPPGSNGNFTLSGGTCLQLGTLASGLQLTNTCSKPCCDCPELNAIVNDLNILGSQATTTQNFANRLTPEVEQFSSVVLGSRLSDTGCSVCNVTDTTSNP